MGLLITGLPPLTGRALLDCAAQLVAAASRVSEQLAGRDPYAGSPTASPPGRAPAAAAPTARRAV
jgi:hypothetical protein